MKRLFLSFAVLTAFGLAAFFSSCNVTRKVSTESSYFQRGDTNIVITTKTIESYDASKKLPSNF